MMSSRANEYAFSFWLVLTAVVACEVRAQTIQLKSAHAAVC